MDIFGPGAKPTSPPFPYPKSEKERAREREIDLLRPMYFYGCIWVIALLRPMLWMHLGQNIEYFGLLRPMLWMHFGPMTYFVPYLVWMHLGLSLSPFRLLHSQNSETGFIWAFTPYLAYFVPCDAFMDAFQPSESYKIALIFSRKTIFCPCRKMVTFDHKRGPQLSSGRRVREGFTSSHIYMDAFGSAHTLFTRKTLAYFVPAPFEGSGFIWANRLTSSHIYGFIWAKSPPPRGGG